MPVANAVFKGGGVKGIGLVGALAVVEEQGYTWNQVAGTSAGSIVGALVAAGYTAAEIKLLMETEIQFSAFMDRGPIDRLPLSALVDALRIWKGKGIYQGAYVVRLMDRLLSRKLGKAAVTFRDLPIGCRMIASDVTHQRMVVLPDDLIHYGYSDPGQFPVAQAVRASMSIPIFFEPYVLHYQADGRRLQALLVDGGMLSNFPIWLFEPPHGVPEIPTFGFWLQAPGEGELAPTDRLTDYLHALVSTVMEGRDAYDRLHQEDKRIIVINTGSIRTIDFHLTQRQREWLYRSGRQAAEQFFGVR